MAIALSCYHRINNILPDTIRYYKIQIQEKGVNAESCLKPD